MKKTILYSGTFRKANTSNETKSELNLDRWLHRILTSHNVAYVTPCCRPVDVTNLPVRVNTGVLQYFNGTDWVSLTTGFYPQVAQNDIAAGTGGAILVTNYLTTINTDAGGDAFTLANGTVIGQLKKIQLVVDGGGNAVITPANLLVGTTITMNDAGDYVILQWNGTDWVTIENSGATIA
jgi:hypothetical protein